MSTTSTPSARWDAMTDQEKVEWLATEVMGWRRQYECDGSPAWFDVEKNEKSEDWYDWNPLTDWNHWRQVEEKVMDSPELWQAFLQELLGNGDRGWYPSALLPTRAKALYLAFHAPR